MQATKMSFFHTMTGLTPREEDAEELGHLDLASSKIPVLSH